MGAPSIDGYQATLLSHTLLYTPSFPVVLKFFNRAKRCVLTKPSTELLHFVDYSHPLFHTPLEYIIAIWNKLEQVKWANPDGHGASYSYIEVWDSCAFIRRHYVRYGHLTPFTSTEEDIALDPYIRDQQVSERPVVDWGRVVRDAMFAAHKGKLGTVSGFVSRYKK